MDTPQPTSSLMKKGAVAIGGIVSLILLPTIPVLIMGGVAWVGRRLWINRQRKLS